MSLSYDFVGQNRESPRNVPQVYRLRKQTLVFNDSTSRLIGAADDVFTNTLLFVCIYLTQLRTFNVYFTKNLC